MKLNFILGFKKEFALMHNCSFICIPCKCDRKWHDNDCQNNNGRKGDNFNYNFDNYYQNDYGYSQRNYQNFQQNDYQRNNCGCNSYKKEEKKEHCCHQKSCCFCDFFKSWNDF